MSEGRIHPAEEREALSGDMQMSNPDNIGINIDPAIKDIYQTEPFSEQELTEASGMKSCRSKCGIIPKCICIPFACCEGGPLKMIPQGFIGIRQSFGEYVEKMTPGLHTYNSCTDEIILMDLRTQIVNTDQQLLITNDNVTIRIDCFGFYKIIEPEKALVFMDDLNATIKCFIYGALQSAVSERSLEKLLHDRDELEASIENYVVPRCQRFGIKILDVDIQEINLPGQLIHDMADVAISKVDAEAKVIKAEGNLKSAKLLKEAADEYTKNRVGLQLQYMNILKEIAYEKPTKLVLPLQLSRKD